MIDQIKKQKAEEQKEKVRKRIKTQIDPNEYAFIPAKKQVDYYDNDIQQRVAVYARVSTDNIQQTSSYELQKKYYEDFVIHHPNWILVKIYADEGTSGTSTANRDEFNKMIADCRAGRIDMILTKSVSRFARNVVDCISMVRTLSDLPHPVGVFFESECIFSLKDDSQMALSFLATMAQEESHIRSRSMETSLRMRLDGGLPLTPKLLGYSHDSEGNLVINPDEEATVKLVFSMYLYGYSTSEIATTLTELGRKTYLGNITWSSNSVVQVLRNERHCGDVLTRKTFTPNYLNHKAKKNRGDRPQSIYRNHHEAIVSRDDFIAVQRLLENAKYGNKSILPELRVIDSGLLKGFVIVNPRWAGFKSADYYDAAISIKSDPQDLCEDTKCLDQEPEIQFEAEAGAFDMRGFEITRSEMFDSVHRPYVIFQDKKIKFSTACIRKFDKNNHIELLVDPINMKFAVRTISKDNKYSTVCSKHVNDLYYPKEISCAAFLDTLFEIFGWNTDLKYRILGAFYQKDDEIVFLFKINDAEAFIKPVMLAIRAMENDQEGTLEPLSTSGKRVRAVPEEWVHAFGNMFYTHQHIFPLLESKESMDLNIREEGRLYETGEKICMTGVDELSRFISQELMRGNTRE